MPAKRKTKQKDKPVTTIRFTTHPNPFPEAKGKGEHFGTLIPNGTANQSDVIDRMIADGCQLGPHEIQRILNAIGFVVLDLLEREHCGVDLGFCKLRPVIKGTFDYKDGEFDPKRHKIQIEAIPSKKLRHALEEGVKAVNVMPVESPRIDSVCCAPDCVRNTISVVKPFEILGARLTVRHGDETAELALPSGGSLAVSLKRQTRVDGTQRVRAQLAEPPPSPCPKRAQLVLRTHGLGGAGSPLFTVKSANLKLLS